MIPSTPPRDGERIWQLFNEAAALGEEARAAWLDAACKDDPGLREEVDSLLEADAQADGLLEAYVQPLLQHRDASGCAPAGPSSDRTGLIGRTVSQYHITEYLGEGGMGVAYRAEDTRLRRTVALKFLRPESTRDPEANARFMREARAASTLDHPNIAAVHEVGEADTGQLFIVMTYYPGETLKRKIARGLLSIDDALDYAEQTARGLQRAHEVGIIHRDVKPANLIIANDEQVKLVDFGLAKVNDASQTAAGSAMGTVAYMSPEQATGRVVDARTDLWSLGVVLYEMVTGQRPFGGDHPASIIHAIRHEAPEPPATLRPGVPPALRRIVEKALSKDPADRYQRAEQFLDDLQSVPRAKAGSPLTSGHSTLRPRTWRVPLRLSDLPWWKRRGVLYASLAAAALVLALLGMLTERPAGQSTSARAGAEGPPSIAVLPFENRSRHPDQVHLSEAMTDELNATLTRIEGIRVVPRQSVEYFHSPGQSLAQLAQSLQVDYFVDGSMLWEGDQVRVTVHLIEPSSESVLSGQSFGGAARDVLTLQQEVARALMHEIQVQLTPADEARLGQARQVDPRAFDLYVRGRYVWDRPGSGTFRDRVRSSLPYFEQALALDSSFADAHAAVANAYLMLGFPSMGDLPWEEAESLTVRHLERALTLDAMLPRAHAVRGVLLQRRGEWEAAERALREAISLDPGQANRLSELGLLMLRTGRQDEALELTADALQADPISYFTYQVTIQGLLSSRRYEEAIVRSREALALYPDFWLGRWGLGTAYLRLGRYDEAVEVFEAMVAEDSLYVGNLVYTYAAMGREDDARRLLAQHPLEIVIETKEAAGPAAVLTALGDYDAALDWIEQRPIGELRLTHILTDPSYEPLHADPRFQAVLRQMGVMP